MIQAASNAPTLFEDPVCHMRLELRNAAAMAIHHGRGYYFCSSTCRENFHREPERYARTVRAERLS
ncbi:MAG: YHS domain-containing protein, partial [Pseudomonadota bacterium]|nr:YHS domain-containing protein [Pseudomonadota bacterium]